MYPSFSEDESEMKKERAVFDVKEEWGGPSGLKRAHEENANRAARGG